MMFQAQDFVKLISPLGFTTRRKMLARKLATAAVRPKDFKTKQIVKSVNARIRLKRLATKHFLDRFNKVTYLALANE